MAIESSAVVATSSRPNRVARLSRSSRPVFDANGPASATRETCEARAELDALAAELRVALAPESMLEHLLIDRLALSAWRLDRSTRVEARALIEGDGLATEDGLLAVVGESRRAERGLETALRLLERVRASRRKTWGVASDSRPNLGGPALRSEPVDHDETSTSSRSWAPLRDRSTAQHGGDADDMETTLPRDLAGWEERLIVDPNVSQVSPVVRGTWVTARQVVALIVDGWTWSDILRTHPELTEADIRACLAYTVDQDEFAGL